MNIIHFIFPHLLVLYLLFITLQLVHQFTSNATTIYCYNVKTIKKLNIIQVYCKLRHVSSFSQTILRENPELLKPTS